MQLRIVPVVFVCLSVTWRQHHYPAPRMCSKGSSDCSWPGYAYVYKKFRILQNTHFQKSTPTQEGFSSNLIAFSTPALAAPEVFVAFANPVSLPSRYRVGITRHTNIDQIEATPLRYCWLARDMVDPPSQAQIHTVHT